MDIIFVITAKTDEEAKELLALMGVRLENNKEEHFGKKAMIIKSNRKQKYKVRAYNRCKICGRPHAYLRKFSICRICFRELAHQGAILGGRKASW